MGGMSLEELYQEILLDHFKNPRCVGCPNSCNITSSLLNPLCGDTIDLGICFDGGSLKEIGFTGHGCSISQASASMMSSLCKGKPLSEVKFLISSFVGMIKGEKKPEDVPELADALSLAGVRNFPARMKCALLAWEALGNCVSKAEMQDHRGMQKIRVNPAS